MKYYQDITLLPDPETDLYFLWQKVYQQLHLALVEQKGEDDLVSIGFSWPTYQYSKSRKHLGNKLRILAPTESDLQELDIEKWLSRLTDYVHITKARQVPPEVKEYASFSRVQTKSNKARIARRKAKRENTSVEQALEALEGFIEKHSDLPFIRAKSLGGGQNFNLPIRCELKPQPKEGRFSCYGLSRSSTVPWF